MTKAIRYFLYEKTLIHLGGHFGVLPSGMAHDVAIIASAASIPTGVYQRTFAVTQRVVGSVLARVHTPHVKPGTAPKGRTMKVHTSVPRSYGIRRIGGGPPLGVSIFAPSMGIFVAGMIYQHPMFQPDPILEAV